MKIKLTILDSDKEYLKKLVEKLSIDYADRLEILSFSEAGDIYPILEEKGTQVFLAEDGFQPDAARLPQGCCFAYLTRDPSQERLQSHAVIGKYQKYEMIYKQILALHSEQAGRSVSLGKKEAGQARVIAFQPASGGAGSSTLAAACALHFAAQGKKVLYLNLEKTGSSEVFFHGPGTYTMSDIIYTIKSSKGNLAMRLESCLRQDPRGVSFYAPSASSLDMFELSPEDLIRLMRTAVLQGGCEMIVADLDFSLREEELPLLELADSLVWVSTGDEISNGKLLRAYQALKIMDEKSKIPLLPRLSLVFNKATAASQLVLGDELRHYGAPKVSDKSGTRDQLLEYLAAMQWFDNLLN